METCDLLLLYKTDYGEKGGILHTYSAEFGFLVLRSFELDTHTLFVARGDVHTLAIVSAVFDLPHPPYTMGILRRIEKLYPYHRIQTELVRNCISLFMGEVLERLLRTSAGESALFNFIKRTLGLLNELPTSELQYFTHRFVLGLAIVLGFQPQGEYCAETPAFNLRTGLFQEAPIVKNEVILSRKYASVLSDLLMNEPIASDTLSLSERNELLTALIHYLEIHQEVNLNLKSLAIIQEVLHG